MGCPRTAEGVWWRLAGVVVAWLCASSAWAEEAGESLIVDGESVTAFEDLSLEDLLNTEIDVATKAKAKSVRESPGIVTVISREEILRSSVQQCQLVL